MNSHPSSIGNGWSIICDKCRPGGNVLPAFPADLTYDHPIAANESASESDCCGHESSHTTDTESDH